MSSLNMADSRLGAEGDGRPVDYARPPEAPPAARLRFRPALLPTLFMLAVVATCLSLAQWQWGKAERKTALQYLLEQRSRDPAIAMPTAPVSAESLRYRRVIVIGRFEPDRQILIDNRPNGEASGYHVVTPLRLEGSDMRVLVNRGWVPAARDRNQIPDYAPPVGPVRLTAIATQPSSRFFTLAPEPAGSAWQSLWQNLDLQRYKAGAGFPVQDVVLLLDPDQPGGYARDWPRPDERVERHTGYALQWLGFAVAALGIWIYVNLRKS